MSLESNKAIVRRQVEEILNGRNANVVGELFTESYAPHDLSHNPAARDRPYSHDDMRSAISGPTAFPDGRVTIDDISAEGDKVWFLWSVEATHLGELRTRRFGTIPPTGNRLTWKGISIYRIEDGKIAEAWTLSDGLGMFEQLGALPTRV